MTGSTVSAWEQEMFGAAAFELRQSALLAVPEGHRRALAAHAGGELKTLHAYGHTVSNAVAEVFSTLAETIPGVVVQRPPGVRTGAALVMVKATGTAIDVWRYAREARTRREDARMAPSQRHKALFFEESAVIGAQLTLEQGQRDIGELEAEMAEEEDLRIQLRAAGRVVILGYASYVNDLRGIGWGQIELTNAETGAVHWYHWEPLDGTTATAGVPLRTLESVAGPGEDDAGPRFDHGSVDTGFGLTLRRPSTEIPSDEPAPPKRGTGTDTDGDSQ